MLSEQCISVTELAKNTSGIIKRAITFGTQYIFVNNKPQAVILSMKEYEAYEKNRVEFGYVHPSELSEDTLSMIDRAKKLSKKEFIDL
jgi:hypothetical protein